MRGTRDNVMFAWPSGQRPCFDDGNWRWDSRAQHKIRPSIRQLTQGGRRGRGSHPCPQRRRSCSRRACNLPIRGPPMQSRQGRRAKRVKTISRAGALCEWSPPPERAHDNPGHAHFHPFSFRPCLWSPPQPSPSPRNLRDQAQLTVPSSVHPSLERNPDRSSSHRPTLFFRRIFHPTEGLALSTTFLWKPSN
jgi:hypothetical protein